MPNSIPDIEFRSYDEFRLWERSVASILNLAQLLEENENNVALSEEILGTLDYVVSSSKDAISDLADEWAKGNEEKARLIFDYQSEASTLVMTSISMSDQILQLERRANRES